MADIFISYSRSDRTRCAEIAEALKALRTDVWFDVGIEPGHAFDREIERAIDGSRAVLVLWSNASVASDWVRNESRTGKETGRLIAAQLEPCQLPLEFRSVQAELLPADRPLAESAAWYGILRRVGELTGRPGLGEAARLLADPTSPPDHWRLWIAAHPDDPLVATAVERMVDAAAPDLRAQLAQERARRTGLEAELAELNEAVRAQANELTLASRDLARARHERDQAQEARAATAAEIEGLRTSLAAGKRGVLLTPDAGSAVLLDQRLAIYICVLMWALALWFLSSSVGRLFNSSGGLSDVFWLVFGTVALVIPAALTTALVVMKRVGAQAVSKAGTAAASQPTPPHPEA